MNQQDAIKAMKAIVIPCMREAKELQPDADFEIEGGNATAHTGKKTRSFINSKALPVPQAPNFIENDEQKSQLM